jgi:fermentation-respiration switch protein FrsA (DUF1100 family)
MMLKIIIIAIVVIAAILIAAGNYFYNFSILRRKKEFLSNDPDLKNVNSAVAWDSQSEWLQAVSKEELTIASHDGLKLYAQYLPAPSPSDKTVVLIHGYSSWHGSMGGFARYYNEGLGFNVLLPDLRGHGKSEGNYIGFGWHDRKDILQWIDVLLKKAPNMQIVLHGVSMGGGTVLMTSGEMLPFNVKCIVSDCAYNSVTGILGYQMKRMFKLSKFPLMNITSLICKLKAGYYFGEASALKQVKKSVTPILFIHGDKDKFVPTEMVYELYEAAQCPKQLLVIKDASHGTAFWQDQAAYKYTVEKFIGQYIK